MDIDVFIRTHYFLITLLLNISGSLLIATSVYCGITAYCLPPGPQFMYTIRYINEGDRPGRKRKELSTKKIHDEELKAAVRDELEIWVDNSYLRLGKNLRFEDFLYQSKNVGKMFLFLGLIVAVVGLITKTIPMVAIGFLCVVLFNQLGRMVVKMNLSSQIKSLDEQQLREMPLLLSRFISISASTNSMSVSKVLEDYYPYATALKYDIRQTLADIRSLGPRECLSAWQQRVALNSGTRMLDFQTALEKIKKLYEKGDVTYCKSELSALRNKYDDKYINTFVDKKMRQKYICIIGVMFAGFVILGIFAMIPMLIQVQDSMANFNGY